MRKTLGLIFFLSGASALIFESLWFRLAGLSLGNSVWSASLVLAAFMGGLALGNGLVARLHRDIVRPVRLYAVLEFAIGIGGIAVVLLLPRLPGLLGPALGSLTDTPVLLNAVRLTIAFGVLLAPAIAMGATLPVLAQAMSRQDQNFGANIGWLYGWNTLGAMTGAICAEMFLVPALGILQSGFVALLFNIVAAFIALRIAQQESAPAPAPPAAAAVRPISMRCRRLIGVSFDSGALMLALEVVWFRFLLLTRDGSSLIFAVMLAVVLAGIAIGGLVAGRMFERDEKAYRWLRHVTAASAALVVLTFWGYDLFSTFREQQEVSTPVFVLFATFLMFPVAALSGMAFTMVNRAVKNDLGSSARTAGIATLFNTLGAMLGSLAAGFILLPVFGMELSFFAIAIGYLMVAFLVPGEPDATQQVVLGNRIAVGAAVASLVLFPFGLMRETYFSVYSDILPNQTLVTTREGLTETIRYYRRDIWGEPKYYRLVTNGHSMSATTIAAKRYMKLYVYLPVALKPNMEDALLISFGVGSTARALTDTASLESIDVVDISKDILELSDVIYPGDDNPLRDERVKVHIEDGRFFLNTTDKRYDLITSEPPPPKNAGVVNLYSQEYFELIRSRLNPGGYASYWLPVQQLETSDTLAITRAFCNAFDDCSLWSGGGLEWMLMGSNGAGRQADAAQFSAQWDDPLVADEIRALGFETPAQMGSLFMADAAMLGAITADVPPVRDNYPARISSRVVHGLGHVELYAQLMDEDQRLQRFRDSELIARIWPESLKQESEAYFAYERMIKNHLTIGVYRTPEDPYSWEAFDDLMTDTSLKTLPLWLMSSDTVNQAIVDKVLERDGYRDEFAIELARRYTAERDYETALRYLNAHVSKSGNVTSWESIYYLYLLSKAGKHEQAEMVTANLAALGRPDIDRFLEWHAVRFGDRGQAQISDAAALD